MPAAPSNHELVTSFHGIHSQLRPKVLVIWCGILFALLFAFLLFLLRLIQDEDQWLLQSDALISQGVVADLDVYLG